MFNSAEGLLDWLTAPTDLRLIEKSETMLHVDWVPPEIFDEEKRELLTHYRYVRSHPFAYNVGFNSNIETWYSNGYFYTE